MSYNYLRAQTMMNNARMLNWLIGLGVQLGTIVVPKPKPTSFSHKRLLQSCYTTIEGNALVQCIVARVFAMQRTNIITNMLANSLASSNSQRSIALPRNRLG